MFAAVNLVYVLSYAPMFSITLPCFPLPSYLLPLELVALSHHVQQVAASHGVSCKRWENLTEDEIGKPQITIMDIQARTARGWFLTFLLGGWSICHMWL